MAKEDLGRKEPKIIPEDKIEILPSGAKLPAREGTESIAKRNESMIHAVDPALVDIYRERGIEGIISEAQKMQSDLDRALDFTRQAATFYPGAAAQMHKAEHEKATPDRHPDAPTSKIKRIYELIDQLSGGKDFFQAIGAQRGTDGLFHIEGIEQSFLALVPLPGEEIVLGSTGTISGRANLFFINLRKKRIASPYKYILVAPLGEYIVAKRPTLGSTQPTAELIDPATGRAWFGEDGRFKDFIHKGDGVYGVLNNPDQYGKTQEKVPPPPARKQTNSKIAEKPQAIEGGPQKALPEAGEKERRRIKSEDFIT